MSSYKTIEKLFILISRHRRIDGLWLGILGGKKDEVLLDRVEQSLLLIKNHDPPRYARLRRDLKQIWIVNLIGARGRFDPATNRCSLDYIYVKSAKPASIASTIVHEATHAHPWLRRLGYPEALRARIERICMRQQQAFARKLPADNSVKAELEPYLSLPATFWSDANAAGRLASQQVIAARAAGIPDWLTKLLQKIGQRLR